jgi:hypothetical protein
MRIVDTGTTHPVQPADQERIGVIHQAPRVDQVLLRTIAVGTTEHGMGAITIGTRPSDVGSCLTTTTTRLVQPAVPARTGKIPLGPQVAQVRRLIEICVTEQLSWAALRRPHADASPLDFTSLATGGSDRNGEKWKFAAFTSVFALRLTRAPLNPTE